MVEANVHDYNEGAIDEIGKELEEEWIEEPINRPILIPMHKAVNQKEIIAPENAEEKSEI